MEPILFIGGIIVLLGGVWTVQDLLMDAGLQANVDSQKVQTALVQSCSGFKSRDISSSTACRAGFSA